MTSQIVPIQRTNTSTATSTASKNDIWFNAFDFNVGQDSHIRWLSRPNQQLVNARHSHDVEKFRITFDVENFQPEQIKIYIQNHKLTINGVYEEHSENRTMQKQFERTFDLPANADVESMASFITPGNMLVVEIPLLSATQVNHLSINDSANNARRVSFSLNKFNTTNNQDALSTLNDSSSLLTPASGQQVRRTSITKTTTTTTTNSGGLSPETLELLKQADLNTTGNVQTYTTHTSERRLSNTGNQNITIQEPNTPSSTTSNKQTTISASDLKNLPVEIPPELLTTGGTITIQRRKVSITRAVDGNTDQSVSVPITNKNETQTTTSTTKTTANTTSSVPINVTNQQQSSTTSSVPINVTNQQQSNTTKNTNSEQLNVSNQQQVNTSERRNSKTISNSNQSRQYTLEEFLQNKTWHPSLVDGAGGKKILYMRLEMKAGTKLDQIKISLNGYDFRVEVDSKTTAVDGRTMNEHSYRQITLFPSCEMDQLKTELKDDGFLHIQVPIKL